MVPHLMTAAALALVLVAHLMQTDADVRVYDVGATDLPIDLPDIPDPYVKVWCGASDGGKSSVKKNTVYPKWSGLVYSFPNCKPGDSLAVELWDEDMTYDDFISECNVNYIVSGRHKNTCRFKDATLFYSYSA